MRFKREIKFRAWNAEYGEMVYSDMNSEFIDKREWYPICFNIGFSHFPHTILDDETKLMQYTGLKDNNDNEIYEGDIIGKTSKATSNIVVKWDNDRSAYYGHLRIYSQPTGKRMPLRKFKNQEVIGNIYENPELLKQSK